MRWGGRWKGGSGWGTYVNPWLSHVNVWQKPLQYYKVISLQLIKINEKKKKKGSVVMQVPTMGHWSLILLQIPGGQSAACVSEVRELR